jgi:VIT1/CCC1 family predicted Fe2+/Mn2+ transporter
MINPSRISFGGTAAIVTSMALIAGLDAAHAGKASLVSALLIAAVADNLTDSLSVHMYQESQRLEQREVFVGTVTNFATRLMVCFSFVLMVALLPAHVAAMWGLAWGISLLTVLTYILARYRNVSALSEIAKHLTVAVAIILVSQRIGHWIAVHII